MGKFRRVFWLAGSLSLRFAILVALTNASASGQVSQIPEGLLSSQAAAVVIGQRNFSSITFGVTRERWGALSGFAIAGNQLVVVDSSYLAPPNNNRVLIYNDLAALRNRKPQDELIPADVVVGQPDFTTSEAGTSAAKMFQPAAVATDGTRLLIAEWGNNRVLIYNQIPAQNGVAADVVIGQQSFTSSDFGTSASRLRRPNGVATDGTRLFVSDTLNNRVLIYNQIPTQNGASASVVLGQSSFDTFQRHPAAVNTMYDPMSATTDGQRLIVTDFGNNRVLIYNQIPTQNGAPADVVVGQDNFSGSDPGNSATRLNFPRYAYSDGTRLIIVDSGNNRILIYNQIPAQNGAAADIVLGQENLNGLLESCAAGNFAVPFMAAGDGDILYVSDSFNRRILGFRPGAQLVSGVVNGASFSTQPQTAACDVILLEPPIAPGGIATIFGTNLAESTELASELPLPMEMGGVTVWFNGIQAPLYYVSPTQINAQVPFDLEGFSASVELERTTPSGSFRSAAAAAGVADGAPGIFTWDASGSGPGIITHADLSPVNSAKPAVPGETLTAFVTGLGSVDLPMVTGAAAEFASEGFVGVSGVSGAGQTITITVNGVPYPYTTVEGDILSAVVTKLAERIEYSSPEVTSSADTEAFEVILRARELGDQGASNVYSAAVSEGGGLAVNIGGLTLIPATLEFSGAPQAGQTIVVTLQETVFEYTAQAGETLQSVIAALAGRIDQDPNVTAQADLVDRTIELALRAPEEARSIVYTVAVSASGTTITARRAGTSSLALIPGSVVIGGTAGPGQVVSIFLAGTRYSYTTGASDTLETVVTGLANAVNGDPNVSATANVSALTIDMALKTPNLNISFSTSVSSADALQLDTAGAGVIPATVTVRGSPRAGQLVTAFVGFNRYDYTVQPGDTLATIAAALAPLLDSDPKISASLDGEAIHLEQQSGEDSLRLDTGGASAIPATITILGVPAAGERITITLGSNSYGYTVLAGDTPESIAAVLGPRLDSDASVVATVDGAAIALTRVNEQATVSLAVAISVTLSTVVTDPAGLRVITSVQHFVPGQGVAVNDVAAFLGETLPAVPGDILFFNAPVPDEIITVTLAETVYSYTTVAGDTLSSVVTKVAAEINIDPNVTATADSEASRILLRLRDPASEARIGFTVSISPATGDLFAIARSATTTESLPASVEFAGPVKGTAGLYRINFTVPTNAPVEPNTKLLFRQNLIIFGSVTEFNIFSNSVTFPVVAPLVVATGGATAVPATLTVSGTAAAGALIRVQLADRSYSYRVVAGDTVESIATSLAALLDADANVSATASGASINLQLTSSGASVTLSVTVGF